MPLQTGNIIKYKVRHPLGLFCNRLAKHPGATPVSINDIERAGGKELLLKKMLKSGRYFPHEAQSYAHPCYQCELAVAGQDI